MIYGVKGRIVSVQMFENFCCVAVQTAGGICFSLKISLIAAKSCGVEIGSEVNLLAYLMVRENCLELFGFFDEDEREMFKMLISVSGVGPNFAISVLSTISPVKFFRLVAGGNEKALCCCKGIGLKTASRIVLELKNKIKKFDLKFNKSRLEQSGEVDFVQTENFDEAVEVLVSLGYDRSRAVNAVCGGEQGLSVEQLVKDALKILAG